MFGLFAKKTPKLPDVLYFKSNQAAFEYACKFCITTLENEQPVVGIVLEARHSKCCVNLSNDSDPSVPTQTPDELLNKGMIENICFAAAPIEGVPSLAVGDLVFYVALPELAAMGKGTMAGLIVAKIKPAIEVKTGRWLA